MKTQISKQQQDIMNMDFSDAKNHYFAKAAYSNHISGFGYSRVYHTRALEKLKMALVVNIEGITRISYGTWRISYNCYIEDNFGSIQERFSLNSRVHSESYIDAWRADCPDAYRSRDAYDMLFSQLDEDRLHEKCMGYVERLGESEQERIAANYSL